MTKSEAENGLSKIAKAAKLLPDDSYIICCTLDNDSRNTCIFILGEGAVPSGGAIFAQDSYGYARYRAVISGVNVEWKARRTRR